MQKVLKELNLPNIDVCLQIGQSCDYPNNLWTGLSLDILFSSKFDWVFKGSHLIAQQAQYVNATSQTIMAGELIHVFDLVSVIAFSCCL